MNLKFFVSKETLRHSLRNNIYRCPIANALRKKLTDILGYRPYSVAISGLGFTVRKHKRGPEYSYALPLDLIHDVEEFDASKTMKCGWKTVNVCNEMLAA